MAKKRGGGPKSETGKKNSSRNATTHGCRSKIVVILKDEHQEDYDEMEREWNDEFGPETYMERRLVKILVDNDWFLQRAVRRLHEAEAAEGNVELMQRYKTSAERSFYRSLNALQQVRKDLMRQDRHAEWWKDRAGKLEKELEKRPPAPAEEPKDAEGPTSGRAALGAGWGGPSPANPRVRRPDRNRALPLPEEFSFLRRGRPIDQGH